MAVINHETKPLTAYIPVLGEAIQLAKQGEKTKAARLLAEIVRKEPQNETAWVWLAACLDDPMQQRYCLGRALRINPDNQEVRRIYHRINRASGMEITRPIHIHPAVQPAIPATGAAVYAAPVANSAAARLPPKNGAADRLPQSQVNRLYTLALLAVAILLLTAFLLFEVLPKNQNPAVVSLVNDPFSTGGIHLAAGEDLGKAVQNAQPGAVIYLEQGEYPLQEPLFIENGVRLVGVSMNLTRISSNRAGPMLQISGRNPVTIQGIEFIHEGNLPSDLLVIDSATVIIHRSRIAGALYDPASGQGGRGLVLNGISFTRITDSEIMENDLTGISISEQARAEIKNSTIHNNFGSGVILSGSAELRLESNLISKNMLSGVVFNDNAGGKVLDNQIDQNMLNGIEVTGRSSPVVYKNDITRNQAFGIYVTGEASPMLLNNLATRSGRAGIGFFGSAGGAAQDNDCTENELHGISLSDQAAPFLTGNRCNNNKQVGIDYWGMAQGTAANNQCSENGLQGIAVHESAGPVLENNTCNKNGDTGIIYWSKAAGSAQNNECSENKINGISVHDEASPTIDRNTCKNNASAGISYFDTAGGIARNNECIANGKNLILIFDRSAPLLENNLCEP